MQRFKNLKLELATLVNESSGFQRAAFTEQFLLIAITNKAI